MRTRSTLPWLLLCLGMLTGVVLTGVDASATPAPPEAVAEPSPAATPEEVLRQIVDMDGATYAGPCVMTRSPEDAGKVCSAFVAERGALRAYLTGRAFSEYVLWVFVEQAATGWRAVSAVPLDFFTPRLDIPWPR